MSAFRSQPPTRAILAAKRARHLLWLTLTFTILSLIIRLLVVGGSKSIFAIAMDDLVEIVSAGAMLTALAIEDRPRSAQCPLGYHGVGPIAASISALIVTTAGVYIVWDAAQSLVTGPQPIEGTAHVLGFEFWRGWWLAIIALVTSAYSPWVYWQERPIARDMEWDTLMADATAHLVSALNGLAAIVGITLGSLGWAWGDPAAALIIGLVFLRDGYRDAQRAASRLTNERPPEEIMERLDALVTSKPYVRDHRWMVWLEDNYIDGVLFVAAPDCPLSTVDRWREDLQRELRDAVWRVDDLVIAFGTTIPPTIPSEPDAEQETSKSGTRGGRERGSAMDAIKDGIAHLIPRSIRDDRSGDTEEA